MTSENEVHLKSGLQLVVVGYNHGPGITLYICWTNNGRFKTQPASFPPSQLLTEVIFWNTKVPLQDMGQRRESWDGWWSRGCTHICMSRKSLWSCYCSPAAKDRIHPRESKEFFFLWKFMNLLLSRNCCSICTMQDIDILVFYLNFYTTVTSMKKAEAEKQAKPPIIGCIQKSYFLTDWEKQINTPQQQLCPSSQDPNAKHKCRSTSLGAWCSEVLRSHKFPCQRYVTALKIKLLVFKCFNGNLAI